MLKWENNDIEPQMRMERYHTGTVLLVNVSYLVGIHLSQRIDKAVSSPVELAFALRNPMLLTLDDSPAKKIENFTIVIFCCAVKTTPSSGVVFLMNPRHVLYERLVLIQVRNCVISRRLPEIPQRLPAVQA